MKSYDVIGYCPTNEGTELCPDCARDHAVGIHIVYVDENGRECYRTASDMLADPDLYGPIFAVQDSPECITCDACGDTIYDGWPDDDDDDESDNAYNLDDCPMCSAETWPMGSLGWRLHYTCRLCGWVWFKDIPQ